MSRITVKVNKDLRRISKELERSTDKVTDRVGFILAKGANTIRNDIVNSMFRDAKTGRKYKRGRKTHQASAPGETPAVDTGELARSIVYEIRRNGLEIEIGAEAGAPYAKWLEEGTNKMEARPFLQWFVDWNMPRINKDIERTMKQAFERMWGFR